MCFILSLINICKTIFVGSLSFLLFMLCVDRGVEYECRVSAKNAIDYGTPAVATIHTPEGGNGILTDISVYPCIELHHINSATNSIPASCVYGDMGGWVTDNADFLHAIVQKLQIAQ